MKIVFINLDREVERRMHMERQFAELGLVAERLRATPVAELPPELLEKYCNKDRRNPRTPSEVACTFSHVEAMRAFLAGTDEDILVFEDDVLLSPLLPAFLASFERDRPAGDMIRIETFARHPVVLWPRAEAERAGVVLRRPSGYVSGSAGYIMSRRGAERVLADKDIFARVIDWSLNHPLDPLCRQLEIRHAVPALCVQAQNHVAAPAEFVSALEGERQQRSRTGERRLFRLLHTLESYLIVRPRNLLHRLLGARKCTVPFAGA